MSALPRLGEFEETCDSPEIPNLSVQLLTDSTNAHSHRARLGAEVAQPEMCGRLLRDSKGTVRAIREAKDCSPEELEIKEINTGLYRVDSKLLFEALDTIGTDNAQGEYYLTDMVAYAYLKSYRVYSPVLRGESFHELQGVNTLSELSKAEEYARASMHNLRDGIMLEPPNLRFT